MESFKNQHEGKGAEEREPWLQHANTATVCVELSLRECVPPCICLSWWVRMNQNESTSPNNLYFSYPIFSPLPTEDAYKLGRSTCFFFEIKVTPC